MYFDIVSTIQVHGDRGHGYFVPAPESKDLAGCLDRYIFHSISQKLSLNVVFIASFLHQYFMKTKHRSSWLWGPSCHLCWPCCLSGRLTQKMIAKYGTSDKFFMAGHSQRDHPQLCRGQGQHHCSVDSSKCHVWRGRLPGELFTKNRLTNLEKLTRYISRQQSWVRSQTW